MAFKKLDYASYKYKKRTNQSRNFVKDNASLPEIIRMHLFHVSDNSFMTGESADYIFIKSIERLHSLAIPYLTEHDEDKLQEQDKQLKKKIKAKESEGTNKLYKFKFRTIKKELKRQNAEAKLRILMFALRREGLLTEEVMAVEEQPEWVID